MELWVGIGSISVGVAALIVTFMAMLVSLQVYRSQTDPEVIVFASADESEETLIWIVVQNIGRGLATNISFRWWPAKPEQGFGLTVGSGQRGDRFEDTALIKGLPALGPGSRRVFVWGQFGGLHDALKDHGGSINVACEFEGGHPGFLGNRRRHRRDYVLEVTSFAYTLDRRSDLRVIAAHLEKIGADLRKLVSVMSSATRGATAARRGERDGQSGIAPPA